MVPGISNLQVRKLRQEATPCLSGGRRGQTAPGPPRDQPPGRGTPQLAQKEGSGLVALRGAKRGGQALGVEFKEAQWRGRSPGQQGFQWEHLVPKNRVWAQEQVWGQEKARVGRKGGASRPSQGVSWWWGSLQEWGLCGHLGLVLPAVLPELMYNQMPGWEGAIQWTAVAAASLGQGACEDCRGSPSPGTEPSGTQPATQLPLGRAEPGHLCGAASAAPLPPAPPLPSPPLGE